MGIGGGRRSELSLTDSDSEPEPGLSNNRRIPSGYLAVYVGPQRKRFVIPTRFLKLPIFISLLKKSEEEFGFQLNGGLVFPCEVRFFKGVLKGLQKDEGKFGKMKVDEFLKMFAEVEFENCRDGKDGSNACHGFTPLLQKARV
ncbi:hypothetical protein IFM89_037358 [Coptis chinensis]|uniref:Small auxin up regulated protein n=1 Tax=Coptis chinensis TaxID=261450 RepID=A0A835MBD0_9MAGN|nr:hypothetical protein IFM89_037358 [Coptis chinensis]